MSKFVRNFTICELDMEIYKHRKIGDTPDDDVDGYLAVSVEDAEEARSNPQRLWLEADKKGFGRTPHDAALSLAEKKGVLS